MKQFKRDDLDLPQVKVKDVPGITQERLVSGQQTTEQEIPEVMQDIPIIRNYTIPSSTTSGDYDITFTDLGFTPRFVRVQSVISYLGKYSSSDGLADGTNEYCVMTSVGENCLTPKILYYTDIIHLRTYSSPDYEFNADFVAFIENGITIDIGDNDNLDNIDLILTFYK